MMVGGPSIGSKARSDTTVVFVAVGRGARCRCQAGSNTRVVFVVVGRGGPVVCPYFVTVRLNKAHKVVLSGEPLKLSDTGTNHGTRGNKS